MTDGAATSLRDSLRERGLRATAPRLAVLGCLRRAERPLSHAEVMARLGEETWDRATIYRNLSDLAEAGLLRKTDHGDHVWRFEAADAAGRAHAAEHAHFVCVDCGEVQCLPEVELSLGAAGPRSLQAQQVEVQVRGVCDDCGEGAAPAP